MSTFLSTVLPTQGTYCAVGIRNKVVKHIFCDSVDDIANAGDAMVAGKTDAYFALASFDDKGKGRTADNAAFLRAFFLDLDAGEGKDYPLLADAAKALSIFVRNTGLPKPSVVVSGGGLHAYWPIVEDIPTAQWVTFAKAFKKLCAKHELRADPAVTADAARILRIPGTQNYKTSEGRPVQLVHQGTPTPLADFVRCLPAPEFSFDLGAFAPVQGKTDEVTEDLADDADHDPTLFAKLAQRSLKDKGCNQIKIALVDAATLAEPMWRAALSIAHRCDDGAEAIHMLSREHPDYSESETQAKAEATKGPYTCEWYKENNPSGCAKCPHKITSPIQLGRVVKEATAQDGIYETKAVVDGTAAVTVEIPEYPRPYFRKASGGVWKRDVLDDDAIEVEIYPYDLYVTGRFYDSDDSGDGDGEIVTINLHMARDGVRRFHAPVTALFAKDTLRDTLVRNGVVAYGKQIDLLMAYFASSIRKLQEQYAANRTRNQMGWTTDAQGFVVGELEYTATGTKLAPSASGSRQLAPAFVPTGSLQEWTRIANFYNTAGMEAHALTLFMGFGAPLLKFIGGEAVKGGMVHLKSNASGSGKTTAQMMANSIFGHPYELLMTKEDTYMAKMHRIGLLNSIVFTMDEVTNATDQELSALAYGVTTGRAKHRMESQSNRLRANHTTWCTVTITSANSSLTDKLLSAKATADGELRRVLEIEVPRNPDVPKAYVDELFGGLSSNYGVAGPVFIEYVLKNKDHVVGLLRSAQLEIDSHLKLNQNDRFYSALLAVAYVGGAIANHLKLCSIDVNRIMEFAYRVVNYNLQNTQHTAGSTVQAQETLAAFVADNVNNALIINSHVRGYPHPAPISTPRGQLRMRYEPDSQELFIAAATLREHFSKHQVDFKEGIRHLHKLGFLKYDGQSVPKRIGSGAVAGLNGLNIRCYVFDGSKFDLDTTLLHGREGSNNP